MDKPLAAAGTAIFAALYALLSFEAGPVLGLAFVAAWEAIVTLFDETVMLTRDGVDGRSAFRRALVKVARKRAVLTITLVVTLIFMRSVSIPGPEHIVALSGGSWYVIRYAVVLSRHDDDIADFFKHFKRSAKGRGFDIDGGDDATS